MVTLRVWTDRASSVKRQASSGSGSVKGSVRLDQLECIVTPLTLENQSPPYFQASQCFPMDLDAAARCVHSLKLQKMLFDSNSKIKWKFLLIWKECPIFNQANLLILLEISSLVNSHKLQLQHLCKTRITRWKRFVCYFARIRVLCN